MLTLKATTGSQTLPQDVSALERDSASSTADWAVNRRRVRQADGTADDGPPSTGEVDGMAQTLRGLRNLGSVNGKRASRARTRAHVGCDGGGESDASRFGGSMRSLVRLTELRQTRKRPASAAAMLAC
jgi:hypothetical protein